MNDAVTKFDSWLIDDGPAALVIREHLMPVEGQDGVLFPATYAAAEDKSKFAGGYNIDVFPDGKDIGLAVVAMLKDGRLKPTIDLFPNSPNVCLVDSVGSQANRIEPIFLKPEYADLVPQVVVKAGSKSINLLDAGHRAGDAVVRCSALQKELRDAFRAALQGNAEPLARIAPTSLVFGVWDSRDTQAKLPRLVASTIRAFNVKKLMRSAQFIPATEYVESGMLPDPEAVTDAKERTKLEKAYAERGFIHVPATGSHGGVIATGGVRRDATLSLAALRLLAVRESNGTLSGDRTQTLRRYILGLALVALTAPQSAYLRQGCNLVPDTDKPREFTLVHADGRREGMSLTHAEALAFARAAATAFRVAVSRTVEFDAKLAERDVRGEPGKAEMIKGKITAIEPTEKKFTVKKGNTKVDVTTTQKTSYFKGDTESNFAGVVVERADVEVELAGGVAVKVTAKAN
jgi:CRISPR-associated protein Csb1